MRTGRRPNCNASLQLHMYRSISRPCTSGPTSRTVYIPSYLSSLKSSCTTEPTGRSAGSEAVMPDCAATPELVTNPLQ
jgi:hypothetical protein